MIAASMAQRTCRRPAGTHRSQEGDQRAVSDIAFTPSPRKVTTIVGWVRLILQVLAAGDKNQKRRHSGGGARKAPSFVRQLRLLAQRASDRFPRQADRYHGEAEGERQPDPLHPYPPALRTLGCPMCLTHQRRHSQQGADAQGEQHHVDAGRQPNGRERPGTERRHHYRVHHVEPNSAELADDDRSGEPEQRAHLGGEAYLRFVGSGRGSWRRIFFD